jgi:hypothetical protein
MILRVRELGFLTAKVADPEKRSARFLKKDVNCY